jgi:ZIP family zinc transporter
MNDLLLVLTIATLAAGLTYLGAPIAERFDLPHRVISGALQFAAGVVMAIVAFSLMPTAVRNGPWQGIVPAFFVGGVFYVLLERLSADAFASGPGSSSPGLYIGILIDLVIDGIVIGIGATLTLRTGLLLALGMAVSTMPLAFVTTAIAKRQGVAAQRRQRLAYLFVAAIIGGALFGYLVLRNQPLGPRMILVALASGFLITTVTQGMIPEANKEGEPGFAGILFVGGISLYALMALGLQ